MKALLDLDTYDHPLVFLLFLSLAMVPVLVGLYTLAARFNVPVPAIGAANS